MHYAIDDLEIPRTVHSIIAELADVDKSSVGPSTRLEDILDSVDVVDLQSRLAIKYPAVNAAYREMEDASPYWDTVRDVSTFVTRTVARDFDEVPGKRSR